MPFRRNPRAPAVTGRGRLVFSRFDGEVDYELARDPSQLGHGPKGIRGAIAADPDTAARAFSAGDAFLTLADGQTFRLKMLAHTAGAGQAFFEMWR